MKLPSEVASGFASVLTEKPQAAPDLAVAAPPGADFSSGAGAPKLVVT